MTRPGYAPSPMLPLIVALATPVGNAAIAVVRLSGAGLDAALLRLCGRTPPDRRASLVALRDEQGPLDDAILTVFRGPASYTGEDVAEISCHGNPLIVERLLGACVGAGARVASPGEFTRRAVLHGRLDALGAEAVLATIAATSPAGLELARAAGALRGRVDDLRERVLDIAAELEAILDYPGEDLLFATDAAIAARLDAIAAEAVELARGWRAGAVALEGARVALIGPVNAGKSSLFNALLGRERALVSAEPGTTRDVVESALMLPGGRVTLLDTAGERPTAGERGATGERAAAEVEPPGPVEAAGLDLGRATAAEADLRLVCVPVTAATGWDPPPGPPTLKLGTQCDLGEPRFPVDLRVSSRTGVGLDALRAAILPAITGLGTGSERLVSSARQRDVLLAIAAAAASARGALVAAGPAVAVTELSALLAHIDALAGRDTAEDVLDRLFARFCVGK